MGFFFVSQMEVRCDDEKPAGQDSSLKAAELQSDTSQPVPLEAAIFEITGVQPETIPKYVVHRQPAGEEQIKVDGRLVEPAWQWAGKSPPFRDLISGEPVRFETRAALLWDDDFLYVAYWIEEPNLAAKLTERDAPIYSENDVELFIAGDGGYYELEINALGTLYEAFFVWNDAYEPYFGGLPEFDRTAPHVIGFDGVGFKNHPRGLRTGFMRWDFPGLESAVRLDGTLNESGDIDKGWTVELALPWKGMTALCRSEKRAAPPKDGDEWRMDFSRFNRDKAPPPAKDSGGWAWSRHGVWDSHIPELFVRVSFSTDPVKKEDTSPSPDR